MDGPTTAVSGAVERDGPRLLLMYRTMVSIRLFEEQVDAFVLKGLIHGTTHLYIGMEAVAVGVCAALDPQDYITSTHRGHGHCIAKGADLGRIMAELLGRSTGYCKGKGGSMHIADLDQGNLGATGIVGSGIPVATGAGLALQMRGEPRVVACFFGDGAANQGAFHESLNLAAIWKLPVVYVCENNQYAMSGSARAMFPVPEIASRAIAYGIPGVTVDGNDVLAVREAAAGAVARARRGDGPALLSCETYRWKGHSRNDANRYRTREVSGMVSKALAAAEALAAEGIEAEVLDPRSLAPLDDAALLDSVKRTGRVLITHEAVRTGGVGAEILARIVEGEGFDYLDAPIRRVTGKDLPIPYSKELERQVIPQEEDIVREARRLVRGR